MHCFSPWRSLLSGAPIIACFSFASKADARGKFAGDFFQRRCLMFRALAGHIPGQAPQARRAGVQLA